MILLIAIISNYTIKIMVRSKNGAIEAGHECRNFIDIGYVVSVTSALDLDLISQESCCGEVGIYFCPCCTHMLTIWHMRRIYHL